MWLNPQETVTVEVYKVKKLSPVPNTDNPTQG